MEVSGRKGLPASSQPALSCFEIFIFHNAFGQTIVVVIAVIL
ncbi:MAG TPA: hypothetical protein VE619_08795 [Nitrososphaeraceae archaeon]|nr:hypothetical protein [Nitrososphaeraceae archaeon]